MNHFLATEGIAGLPLPLGTFLPFRKRKEEVKGAFTTHPLMYDNSENKVRVWAFVHWWIRGFAFLSF